MTERDAVADFWNENRQKVHDPTFWMAHPICRQAINRRVTGSPHEWPLDWFKRLYANCAFQRGVSWGCGLGAFERAAIRGGVVERIDAFDLSEASLSDAAAAAQADKLEGVTYAVGDFNDPRLPARTYDVAFFHASLHHVVALERLMRRLSFALRRNGLIYVDEYVGPSRTEWNLERLRAAQAVLDMVPAAARLRGRIPPPVEWNDPSEAVRSSEIPGFLRQFFSILEWRPYGGQIVDLVLPHVSLAWATSDEGNAFVAAMLELEEYEMAQKPESTHHIVAVGRLKGWLGLATPLAQQTWAALRRRMRVYRR